MPRSIPTLSASCKSVWHRLPGRPTKRTAAIVAIILRKIRDGHCLARAARAAKVHPKTAQKWLRQSRSFAEDVRAAKAEGAPRGALVRWVNHPFRGRRPPRRGKDRSKPYPTPPFGIPQNWRLTAFRGGRA